MRTPEAEILPDETLAIRFQHGLIQAMVDSDMLNAPTIDEAAFLYADFYAQHVRNFLQAPQNESIREMLRNKEFQHAEQILLQHIRETLPQA